MKSFKKLLSEVAQPKSEDELNFKDKHMVQVSPHPVASGHQHTGDTTDGVVNNRTNRTKRKAKRIADYDNEEDIDVYEGMDLDDEDLDQRYERERKMELKQKIYDESKLDPVNPNELKKKFKDRLDKDINNDGKVDDSDRYLHNRRKTIAKAMKESIGEITEKAKSEAQQKAAAIALAVKRGEKPKSELIGASKDMYKMSEEDLEDFARTKHKGIPARVNEAENYTITSERSRFKPGYRALIKNPEGKTTYLGSTTYKTSAAAKAAAQAYYDAYFNTFGIRANDRGATKAIAAYNKKNANLIVETVELEEAKGVVLGFRNQFKSREGAASEGSLQMRKLGGSSFSVYKSSNGLWAYKIFEDLDENLGKGMKKFKKIYGTDPRDVKDRIQKSDPEFRSRIKNQEGKLGGAAELQRRLAKKVKESVELDESNQMAAIGRKLQQLAPKEKNDTIANAMANLGDHLESYGTTFGARNMKELEKKTGLTATVIQMLIKRAGATVNEDLEITEISKKLLGSYVKKSKESLVKNRQGFSDALNKPGYTRDDRRYFSKKSDNRSAGIDKAVDRLTKEDLGLDEGAFVAKAAYAKKDDKKHFTLGKKKFPVTIKKDVADEIAENLNENFKTGSVKLDDGSSVLLKKQDADLLNQMFKDLNTANRSKMMAVAMKDKDGFEEILSFAREAL